MPGREYYGKGYGEFSNLPESVVHTEFPKNMEGLNVELDDTARGIDSMIDHNSKMIRNNISDEKY